ncbi:hypothetical protein L861_10295 [Litchfieldella anticariensis FP35 = DSM 16096]|uniref:Uncharacterized protein n=1 Tax=Litchfieldella anticariensis (strain DSM 16096 / CECT 5854 / CIP 108499 / LMG 22089 / FP35) TaxID=1121939 RepID=S2LD48_LITA3|nr:hypothetical protein L861_10295 [Halomonas anticariensis FP35 = DSM 16096]
MEAISYNEHLLVYKVTEDALLIAQLHYRY